MTKSVRMQKKKCGGGELGKRVVDMLQHPKRKKEVIRKNSLGKNN